MTNELSIFLNLYSLKIKKVKFEGHFKLTTLKTSDQALTLGSNNLVKVDGENIQIDPQLLFQRSIVAAYATDLKTALSF